MNKKYLKKMKKAYKSATHTEEVLYTLGVEITDGSAGMIFMLTQCYIGSELGYKKKIPEAMALEISDWLNNDKKTKDFIKTIYEINAAYYKKPAEWEMTEMVS